LTTIRRPAYGSRLQDAESHDKFLLFLRAWRPREQENVVNFAGHPKLSDNYRARVLRNLARELRLPKLNFQVLRRTMATLAQIKGGVKDVQGALGHSKADSTVNVYMQQIEAGVKQTLNAIYAELTATPEVTSGS
jgi:integrase